MGLSDRPQLTTAVRAALNRFRRRLILLRLCSTIGVVLALFASLVGTALLLDRFSILPTTVRIVLSTCTIVVPLVVAFVGAIRLFDLLSPFRVAQLIERLAPGFNESLVSTVQLTARRQTDGVSEQLLTALVESTLAKLDELKPERRLPHRPTFLRLTLGIVVSLIVATPALITPESFGQLARRLTHPTADLPRPSSVELEILPGNSTVATGSEVEIVVTVSRGAPRNAALSWYYGEPTEVRGSVHQFIENDGTRVIKRSFPPLRRPLHYQVRASDFVSSWKRIDVRDPPSIKAFSVTYSFPKYTGRAPETQRESSGNLRGVEGTTVSLTLEASERLKSAALRFLTRPRTHGGAGDLRADEQPTAALAVEGDRASTETELTLAPALVGYEVRLEAQDGVTSLWRYRYTVESFADQSPSIELVEPRSAEIRVEATSVLSLEYRAEDDIGIQAIRLKLSPDAPEPLVLPIYDRLVTESATDRPGRSEIIESSYRFDVARLQLEPGAAAEFSLEVVDVLGQSTQSPKREIRAAFLPHAPEGPGWISRLSALDRQIDAGFAGWSKIAPFAGAIRLRELRPGAATADLLFSASTSVQGILTRMKRTADDATRLAQSIAIATPQRHTLDLVARRLRLKVVHTARQTWTELDRLLTTTRTQTSGPINVRTLVKLHRETGAHLEAAWTDLRSIVRLETIEDIADRWSLVLGDESNLIATWSSLSKRSEVPPEELASLGIRQARLARQTENIAQALDALGEKSVELKLNLLATRFRESCVPLLSQAQDALSAPVSPATREAVGQATVLAESWTDGALLRAHGHAQKNVSDVRDRLDKEDPLGDAIGNVGEAAEQLAAAGGTDGSTRHELELALEVFRNSLGEELAIVQGMNYADLLTVTDLSTIGEIVDETSRSITAVVAQDKAASESLQPFAEIIRQVEGAYKDTRRSRRLGLVIQLLDHVASSEEELTTKLRRLNVWNYRQRHTVARSQRKVSAALERSRKLLVAVVDDPRLDESRRAKTIELIGPAVDRLGQASRHMDEALLTIERESNSPKDVSERCADEAQQGTRHVDDAIHRIEVIRESELQEVVAARDWLRAQRGTLAKRIRRLTDRLRVLAQSSEMFGQSLATSDSNEPPKLFARNEHLRAAVRSLARSTRRESRLFDSNGAQARAVYNHVAQKLVAIAENDLLEASRALHEAESGTGEDPPILYTDAATLDRLAADKLLRLADTLDAIEAEATLEAAVAELNQLGQDTAISPDDDLANLSIEEILQRAEIFLTRARDAAAVLASKLSTDPRFLPVLRSLQNAIEHLQLAVDAAKSGDKGKATKELRLGQELIAEARRLATELRDEQSDLAEQMQESLREQENDQNEVATGEKLRNEFDQAVTDMLEKLATARALQKEADQLFDEILEGKDSAKAEELQEMQEELMEELDENFMTSEELVGLVAKLLEIERDGRQLMDDENRLGRDLTRIVARENSLEALRNAATRQEQLARHGKQLSETFTTHGLRISAALPQVLTSYWQTGEAAQNMTQRLNLAREKLDAATNTAKSFAESERAALPTSIFASADAVQTFLTHLYETRQQALRAMADSEAGMAETGAGQRAMDQAQAGLSESVELSKEGDFGRAQMAHRKSMRSLAEAAQAVTQAADAVTLPGEGEGSGTGLPLQSHWMVQTRGDDSEAEVRFRPTASPEDMPFPSSFRALVRLYLEAIQKTRL